MRNAIVLGVVLGVCALVGCDKGGDGGAPAGSGAPSAGGKSLTKAQLEEAYKAADIDNWDKSQATVKGKLGAPAKSDAETAYWYGLTPDGKLCYELKITKSKGNELSMVDRSACK